MSKPFAYKKVVASAGTRVHVEPATNSQPLAAWVMIQALLTNTGNVYVGDNLVAASHGYILPSPVSYGGSLESITFMAAPVQLQQIHIDADVNGEGIRVIGETFDL